MLAGACKLFYYVRLTLDWVDCREAWKAKEGKSQTEAEAEYIEVVNKLMAEA